MEGGTAGVNLGRASIFDWPLQGVVHSCCGGGKTVGEGQREEEEEEEGGGREREGRVGGEGIDHPG